MKDINDQKCVGKREKYKREKYLETEGVLFKT